MDQVQEVEQTRRNIPGTTARELFMWASVSLEDSDGPFGLQEYIQQSLRQDRKQCDSLIQCPEDQDTNVWIYEHMRQFVIESKQLICVLSTICTKESCTKMTASKFEFLCAAHGKPQECCAIDYIMHTLQGFESMLTKKELFPSRVRIPAKGLEVLKSMPRRLIRIFAHAYFHHRSEFDVFESQSYLCSRFVLFSQRFSLLDSTQIMLDPSTLPFPFPR